MKVLLNTYYFSTLYFNSEIWLTPYLHTGPKQQLFSASANAIKTCINHPNSHISFDNIHLQAKKSTPSQIALYKISLLLYKNFNASYHSKDWLEFSNQIIMTGRQTVFNIHKSNNYNIGLNILSNKLFCLNNKIKLDYLNLPFSSYKYKMMILFLPFEGVV
jgi:hypothetical protein